MNRTAEQRFWAKVQKTDDCWLWTASVLKKRGGYGQFNDGSTMVRAHRFSWELAHGPIPTGLDIDHVCRVRRCVNPDHLRLATRKQNCENRSGLRGVYRVNHRWRAVVTHHGIDHHVGYFDTVEEAAEAARLKRIELFTHNDLDRTNV